jgi:hypothetical protein
MEEESIKEMPMSSRTRPFLAGVFALAVLCLLPSCSSRGVNPPPQPLRESALSAPADSVFLVGDAGKRGAGDQVLAALREEVSATSTQLGSGHVTVIFLGDNIYEDGLPDEDGTRDFRWALGLLMAQVQSANVNPGVMVYFVPGNHDWDYQGPRGLARIRRQTQELGKLGSNVAMLPGNGCPGPAVRTAGDRLQIVFLDTQWWLHQHTKPAEGACTPGTEMDVTAAIENVLSNADGRLSIVVAHHPLISGGPHGRDPWKGKRTNEQDQNHDTNLHMRTAILGALKQSPPVAWVSGHEHTLEVLQGGGAQFLLVSGAGNFGHTETTIPDPARGTWLFPPGKLEVSGGYMRLDIPAEGAPSMSVITVDRNRTRRTVFSRVLESP